MSKELVCFIAKIFGLDEPQGPASKRIMKCIESLPEENRLRDRDDDDIEMTEVKRPDQIFCWLIVSMPVTEQCRMEELAFSFGLMISQVEVIPEELEGALNGILPIKVFLVEGIPGYMAPSGTPTLQ